MTRDLLTALRLLTVLPIGRRDGVHPGRYAALVGWLYAGLALGIAAASAVLKRADGPGALLVAAVIVSTWALASGFMHWDGLADSADAVGVRGDVTRRLQAMKESGIGAFGVVAVVLVALLQTASLAVIIDSGRWWALLAAPVLGRWSAGLALQTRSPARGEGLGARYASHDGLGWVLLAAIPVLALLMPPALAGDRLASSVALTAAGVIVAALAPGLLSRRIGGITGDTLGGSLMLTETAVLVMAAFAGGAS